MSIEDLHSEDENYGPSFRLRVHQKRRSVRTKMVLILLLVTFYFSLGQIADLIQSPFYNAMKSVDGPKSIELELTMAIAGILLSILPVCFQFKQMKNINAKLAPENRPTVYIPLLFTLAVSIYTLAVIFYILLSNKSVFMTIISIARGNISGLLLFGPLFASLLSVVQLGKTRSEVKSDI